MRRISMIIQVARVSTCPLHAFYVSAQVSARVLLMKVLHTAQRQKESNHRYDRCDCNCNNNLLSRLSLALHTFLHKTGIIGNISTKCFLQSISRIKLASRGRLPPAGLNFRSPFHDSIMTKNLSFSAHFIAQLYVTPK